MAVATVNEQMRWTMAGGSSKPLASGQEDACSCTTLVCSPLSIQSGKSPRLKKRFSAKKEKGSVDDRPLPVYLVSRIARIYLESTKQTNIIWLFILQQQQREWEFKGVLNDELGNSNASYSVISEEKNSKRKCQSEFLLVHWQTLCKSRRRRSGDEGSPTSVLVIVLVVVGWALVSLVAPIMHSWAESKSNGR